MKKLLLYGLCLGLLASTPGLVSCTKDFDELNQSPTGVGRERFNENLLFTRSLVYGALRYTEFQRAQHLYANHYAQYYANAVDAFETDRYITRNDWLTAYWTAAYSDFGMQCQQVIEICANDPTKTNKLAIARIWKVFIVHRITDFWGDVPYSQAFTGNIAPRYDRQQDIYADMLDELRDAVASLDLSQPGFGAADVVYRGDVARWAKLGNSLRLRLAMRVSNAAPALAESHVREVLTADNLLASNAESAVLPYGRDFGNADENVQPMALIRSFNEYRASQTLVNFLTQNNDPRVRLFLEPNQGGAFVGLANGLSPVVLNTLDPNNFSRESLVVSNAFAPSGLLTYPEVQLLRAEAALRGWGGGSPAELYEAGVQASVNYWLDVYRDLQARVSADELGNLPVVTITPDSVANYLARPGIAFDPGRGLEQIITQKWLHSLNQGFESYAEYRRTGFPRLNPIPNSDGLSETGGSEVPRRVRYPAEEQALNQANYAAALQQQGPDLPTTRVWWDAR